MDWPLLAALLADRSDKPLVLLDRHARVRLFTRAMEEASGWSRHELEGRSWAELLAPPGAEAATRRWLEDALGGLLRRHECEIVTRRGSRLRLILEMALVGRARKQGLLIAVTSVQAPVLETLRAAVADYSYEVSAAPDDFGRLARIGHPDSFDSSAPDGLRRCYEAFHQRQVPCPDCPMLRGVDEPWPRTVVRRHAGRHERFEVITARPLDASSVRVTVRYLEPPVVAGIREAKIAALADRARLTEREREILSMLLSGRSFEDIGGQLALSPRTVKFHQANILQKLGADSRSDLIRLLD
jgi:PAS domain S-box-containing protein